MLLDEQPWITWLLTSGVDINNAIIDYDKYLRIIKRQVKTDLPFPAKRTAYPVEPTMCDKCLSMFEYDPNNPTLNEEAYAELGLARGWAARHEEATSDPSHMERHHIEMGNAAGLLAWLHVELTETYGDDPEGKAALADIRIALTAVVKAGLHHLNNDKGRLDGATLDRFYRQQADAAGIDHTNF